ncbi:putative Zn(2)-C6 fungal-type domain-containing protein [Seiridium unicorne]|uniref:Zn(2)-C6 fungal-type domain-containing protein n=1 Tax=Seiridium unicorne TaxID=138068 RepID=A0ABR2UFC2_9PEZI
MAPRIRSCDTCRLRKTKCVRKNGKERCILCACHELDCFFDRECPKRRRQRTANGGPAALEQDQAGGAATRFLQYQQQDGADEPAISASELLHTSCPRDHDQNRISTPPAAAYSSILNEALGLDPTNHAEYVGPSDYHNPVLLDLGSPNTTSSSFVWRMDNQAAVHPNGSILVDLYFRFVHPSFPILHKDVFIAKHRLSHRHFTPSLLAPVYLLSLDWQVYESQLASADRRNKPDVAALEQLAEAAIQEDMRTTKLNTLEAGLLLFQRSRMDLVEKPISSIWKLHSQIIATAHGLGVHPDCSSWSIPDWEAGLRRRIAWGFIAAPTGWRLFLGHIELLQILGDINRDYYTTAATRRGGSLDKLGVCAAVGLAKPIIARLSRWEATLPKDLEFTALQPRTLCASACLHLAYHTVIIALYRALVRILTPNTPASLHSAVRSAVRDKLQAALELLGSMLPEHTAAFWGSVASYQAP